MKLGKEIAIFDENESIASLLIKTIEQTIETNLEENIKITWYSKPSFIFLGGF